MPAGRKQKGDTRRLQGSDHLLRRRLEVEAGSLEHISRTHLAAGAAVAVLGHMGTAGRRHEGHSRGDVERVGAITAGAAGIHQRQIRPGPRQRAGLTQHRRHRRQLLPVHTLGAQGGQQRTGVHRLKLLGQPGLHQGRGLLTAERGPLQQLLQQGGAGDRGSHGQRGRLG